MDGSILAQQDFIVLDNGMHLRLLSALEVLQARREATQLAQGELERALCANACLLARALEDGGERTPIFAHGQAVLAGLTVEEIAALAQRWSQLREESGPGLELSEGELEQVKKNSATTPATDCAGGY